MRNVPCRRTQADILLEVDGVGAVRGDVAYGGNWFFLVWSPSFELELSDWRRLTDVTLKIRRELECTGVTGDDGAWIDHVELFGPPQVPRADSKNFVLCPGGAYDRSPCGTGTSAKLACLLERGQVDPGAWYVQESITGSIFRGKVERVNGQLIPTIEGRAYVTAETALVFDEADPNVWGLS
jgi:4-hydroxyproline epimerase